MASRAAVAPPAVSNAAAATRWYGHKRGALWGFVVRLKICLFGARWFGILGSPYEI